MEDGQLNEIVFLVFLFFFPLQLLSAVEFKGKFEQGSFILGKTKPGSKVYIDKRKIRVSEKGFFAFGLDRDRKNDVTIRIYEDKKLQTINKKVLKENIKFKESTVCLQSKSPLLQKFMRGSKKIIN